MELRFPLPYEPKTAGSLLRLGAFSLLAFGLHLLLLLLPSSWLFPTEAKPSSERQVIELSRMTRQTPRSSQALQKTRLIEKKAPPRPRPPDRLRGQVVDLPDTPDQPPPERYRFLSRSSTRTEKETASRYRRLRYKKPTHQPSKRSKAPKPSPSQPRLLASAQRLPSPPQPLQKPTPPTPKTPPKPPTPRPQPPKKGQPPKRETPAFSKDKPLPLDEKSGQRKKIALQPDPKHRGEERHLRPGDRRPKLNYPPGEDAPDTPLSPLHPSSASPASPASPASIAVDLRPKIAPPGSTDGAPAPDHLKKIPLGERTALNSRKWVYASFFNRVQRLVAQQWDPSNPYRRRDPYGNIYGVKDRLTVLSVELLPNGTLADVSVARSSGLSFLDEEAKRAFQKAHPFPNPPAGLVERDGKIRFRFGFFLDLSSRVRFRLFR